MTIDIESDSINWNTIDRDGSVSKRKLRLAELQTLSLTESPASNQTQVIRRLAVELGHPDYQVREAAERQLSDPELAGGFRETLEPLLSDPRLEVRYRAQRVLDALEQADLKPMVELDRLTLIGGEQLEGDAGDFVLQGTYFGQAVRIDRRQVVTLQRPAVDRLPADRLAPLTVETAQSPDTFYQPRHTIVDFSTSPSGDTIDSLTNVERLYEPLGLKLSTEESGGELVVSTYSFGQFNTPAQGNSIAIYVSQSQPLKRFKGVTVIEFGVPEQPQIPAGVLEFGLFIARVDAGRDFIMEGYDARGELLVTVESPDARCGFMGFRSSRPVSRIRVLSNPHLFRISRAGRIDEDYGLDHFCYSRPVPVALPASPQGHIRLRSGDLLTADAIRPQEAAVAFSHPLLGQASFPWKDVHELAFASPDGPELVSDRQSRQWLATLTDASQLQVEPGNAFNSTLTGTEVADQDWVGLHLAASPVRFPLAGDLEVTGRVLVFPVCRLIPESIDFEADGFSWPADTPKLLQPVDAEDPLGVDGLDPTPTNHRVNYEDSMPAEIPSVWLAPPPAPPAESGVIDLRDGQRLVFGPEPARFQFQRITGTGIVVGERSGTAQISIPINQVEMIRFP